MTFLLPGREFWHRARRTLQLFIVEYTGGHVPAYRIDKKSTDDVNPSAHGLLQPPSLLPYHHRHTKNASLIRADAYFFCQCFENAKDDKISMKRMAATKIADVALVQICASSTSSWSRGLPATYMYAVVPILLFTHHHW